MLRSRVLSWLVIWLSSTLAMAQVAAPVGADFDALKRAYDDSVPDAIGAAVLEDAKVEDAAKAIAALADAPSLRALELLSGDATKSGERLLDVTVKLQDQESELQELTKKLAKANGSERDPIDTRIKELERTSAEMKALRPKLVKLREALYDGVLTVTARVSDAQPEEVYDALVAYFETDVKLLASLDRRVSEQGARLATLTERMPGMKEDEKFPAEREAAKLTAALELNRADLERQTKLKDRRIASAAAVFGKLPKARQSKEIADLRAKLKDDVTYETRSLAIEILGHLPLPDAMTDAVTLLKRAAKTRAGLEKELVELRETYRKAAEALVTSAIGGNGMVPVAVAQNEQKCRAELTEASQRAYGEGRVMEAAGRALGVAVNRRADADKTAGVEELSALLAKEREEDLRTRVVAAIGAVDADAAREVLRNSARKDPVIGVRLAALDALAKAGDDATVQMCIDELLRDGDWRVRAATMRLLGDVRQKAVIPALIQSLGAEVGRLVDDAEGALAKLTGQRFNGDANLWKDWWSKNKDTFEIGKVAQAGPADPSADTKPPGHVSFYGIATRSNRILFVLDRSGSMKEPATENVGGKGGGRSKFDVAREQLKAAVSGLTDGEMFNVITYSADVTRWQKKMVPMSKAIRAKFDHYVDKEIEAVGGTNIYDALAEAFRLAGIGAIDKAYEAGVDTIFFLTDGQPTQGEVLDPEEILRRVKEKNRLSRIVLHTVGVGKDHDATFLRRLAEQNGGQYVGR
jgi:HEAT repeat protein